MLYLLIIKVYNTELRLRYCYLFSFGEFIFQYIELHILNKVAS